MGFMNEKKWVLCITMMLAIVGVFIFPSKDMRNVQAKYKDGFVYGFCWGEDGTSTTDIYIIGYFGDETNELVIPDTIDGKKVRDIEGIHNKNIKKIVVSEGIKYIREEAFVGCESLEAIELPASAYGIDIKLSGCNNLKSIQINENNEYYSDGGSDCVILNKSKDTLIAACKNSKIPDSVTTIRYGAFQNSDGLVSITIPDTVTEIGSNAFSGCTNLKSIVIPDSVTEIGSGAFRGCTSLKSIVIPDNVTEIWYDTFGDCKSLKNVTIPNGVTTIGSDAFSNCVSLETIDIPSSVTTIGSYVFSNCVSLETIDIPSSVSEIESGAFSGCKNLVAINLPASIKSIKDYLFSGCSKLSEIVIPDGVKYIHSEAFYGCSSLKQLNIPASVEWIDGRELFAGCSSLENIKVSDENGMYNDGNGSNAIIETNSNTLVAGCKNTVIPDGVTSIAESAFKDCKGLVKISIPRSVTDIDYTAFKGCAGLQSIVVDDQNAMYNDGNGSNVIVKTNTNELVRGCNRSFIPQNIKKIGISAFEGCDGLISIEVPGGVTEIGSRAFMDCGALTKVTLPSGLREIKNCLFENCTSLTEVTIPEGVTTIGVGAFGDCASLKKIVIPKNVRSIEFFMNEEGTVIGTAFYGCKKLESIVVDKENSYYNDGNGSNAIIDTNNNSLILGCKNTVIPSGVKEIGPWSFKGCTALRNITFSQNIEYISDGAFEGCTGLTDVTIPANVKSIEDEAFKNCSNLKSVIFEGAKTSIACDYWNPFENIHKDHVITVLKDSYALEDALYWGLNIKIVDKIDNVSVPNKKPESDDKKPVSNNNTGTVTTTKTVQVQKITLKAISKKIAAGKKVALETVVLPTNASNKEVVYKSSNEKYATVSDKGIVQTTKAGAGKSVTITATAKDGSKVVGTYKIKIVKHVVKGVKISASKKTVKAGKKLTLKAKVKTSGKTANKTLLWTSSNTKYATVSKKGIVKTKKAGKGKKVKITAKATDGSNKKASVTIKIVK